MMNGVAGGLMGEIERAFAEEYGFGAPPRITRTIVAKSASELGPYVGRYVGVAGKDTVRFDVSIAPDGKTLQVYNSVGRRTLPIAPLGGDRFVGLEGGGEWTFERAGDGSATVRSLAIGTGANRRLLVRE